MKYLIINADDFGMSRIFNESILELISKKLALSTTVLVNRVADDQKGQIEKLISLSKKINLSVGLHLEFENTNYPQEIRLQYARFEDIMGFLPSHIDIHKAHAVQESFPYVAEFCRENSLPMRNSGRFFEGVRMTPSESLFGSVDNFSKIEQWIETFKDGEWYEVMFHPGKYDPNCKSSLNKERERDVQHIIELNSILKQNDIKMVSYFDFKNS